MADVKIIVDNTFSKIQGILSESVQRDLDNTLSYRIANSRFIPQVKSGAWDGVIRLYFKVKGQSFYTGLMSLVRDTLTRNNVTFEIVDRRIKPDQNYPELQFTYPEGYTERDYQTFTINRALKFSRGILNVCTGGGKCLGKGTKVLMFNGRTKNVEDVVVGDLLMGPDSTPRTVKSVAQGYGDLYLVKQNNGDDFICNDAHILCLKSTSNKLEKENDYKDIEITAADYYGSTDRFKRYHKGYKVGVDFSHIEVPIDPYWFGLWLGDGNSDAPIITSGDKVKEDLKNLRVLNNKHIPDCYKYNDRQLRLKLLAGLIDSDGNLDKTGAVEFCNTNKVLAEDVLWLARSLGFRSSLNTKKTSIKSVGYSGISYRVRISGKISDIPILLKRKMAVDKTTYNRLQYGIFVNPVGKGEYFGFEIDGDRKFLLGDFTVTHNTTIVSRLIGEIKTYPFMFYVLTKDLMEQAHEELTKYLNQPIGMIGDSKCDIKKITICTIQTAVMALNQGNTKFKISDYIYDDEETWDEKSIDSAEKLENIKKLIQQTKGLYMDECHHTAAKTCKEVLLASPNAYWRFGGSATPNRESGDDIMIQAVFGAKIVDISASYLIKQNWLVKPYIFFEPVRTDVNLHSYQKVYSECVVKNDPLNDHIADTANHLVSRGLSVLVLVQQYAHGDYLKEKIPGSEFMTGRLTSAKRTQILDDMRSGKLKAVIASSLADEGLNVPTLDAVLLAGCGKSSTRLFQRIGRTLRRDKAGKKKKSIVIVYDHNAKYLSKHVKKVKTLLKREEEFVVRSSAGEKFIFKELDDLLGFKNDTKSVFE